VSAVDERVSAPPPAGDINADLGFGSVVTRESRRRLLNRDGSFNVKREGLRFWESLSFYHYLLTISWTKFLLIVTAMFLGTNTIFALLYLATGNGSLMRASGTPTLGRFGDAFFFSVETLATIGYGHIAPISLAANVIMTIESLIGLLAFAAVAGFVFARFARPTAEIIFSKCALIAPYRGGRAFMFRIVNQRSNQLVNLEARVLLSRRKRDGATRIDREFLQLKLERDSVVFFPLAWTIVHPIDDESPLRDWSAADLKDCDAEFFVLLNGFEETFSQNVHTRSSYKISEIVWGARFQSMFNPPDEDGEISVDIRKLHDFERVAV
jgi:inward rectifier potassium channel